MLKGHRRQAREFALQILYGMLPGQAPGLAIADFWGHFSQSQDPHGDSADEDQVSSELPAETIQFTTRLVEGVMAALPEIDALIRQSSHNWSLERMSRVDLALLRLGAFELVRAHETPTSAIINEAIEIGKRFGTHETPSFVNGILDRIAKHCRRSP